MGFQHGGSHGRVFRGLKKGGRRMHHTDKRSDDNNDTMHHLMRREVHNTNGDRPIMRVPEGFPPRESKADDTTIETKEDDIQVSKFAQKAQADDGDAGVETVYTRVFKTVLPTFDGPPTFFSTASQVDPTPTSIVQSAAQTTAAADNKEEDDQTPSRKPVAQTTAAASSSVETTAKASETLQHTELHASKNEASTTSSVAEVTSSSIVTGDVTSSYDSHTTHNAMLADSTSSMVGGTPLGATSSASANKEETSMTSGEKVGLAMGIIFGLALVFGLVFFCWRRKKSQRGLEEHNEKTGFATAPAPVNRFSSESDKLADRRASTQTSATAPRLSLRPVTQFLPNLTGSGNSTENRGQQGTAQNPFGDAAVLSEKQIENGHDRANSVNSNASSEDSRPVTAGSGQVATASAVPVARGPNNVHRVQLEFKPSMEDELELKSGQLVRMLHEYDDGWALCTTMDRNQKGVVPRTCLSKMPVKPRGPPPQNRSPPGGRDVMQTPPPGANSPMYPGPLTPTQQGRPRAPTLDNVPSRKPVPGQAL